jgi:metal-responsive CopG/Arc/MetJ family transcriptional regulator
MTKDRVSVLLNMDAELLAKLDEMVAADDSDRSKFIRRLIRNEWETRQALNIVSVRELPHPAGTDGIPLVTIK